MARYRWYLVQADCLFGLPWKDGCIKLMAGSVKEARSKAKQLGYSKIGSIKPV